MLKAKIKGVKSLNAKLKAFGVDAEQAMADAVADVALKIRDYAIRGIQRGARSGILYTRGNDTHRASAPGEFPKTDGGGLASSITAEAQGVEATVGSRFLLVKEASDDDTDGSYPYYLEFGTSKMAPRPWLRPSIENNKEYARTAFTRAVAKKIKEAGRG